MNQDDNQFQDELRELHEARVQEREAARRSAQAAMITSTTLVLIVLSFLAVNVSFFRDAWSEDKVVASLSHQAELLTPSATNELMKLGTHLAPVFAEEAGRQFERLTPVFETRLDAEKNLFLTDLQADAFRRMQDTEEHIRNETVGLIRETYPELDDSEDLLELATQMNRVVEDTFADSIMHVQRVYMNDAARMESTLAKFTPASTHESTADLQRKVIHLSLMLMDQELMAP